MEHERLEPGTHLRKNQKQILAMLRASTVRAGLQWEVTDLTGSVVRASVAPSEGADPVATVEATFSTDGVKLSAGRVGAEPTESLALYTDTRWMMETLEALLAEASA